MDFLIAAGRFLPHRSPASRSKSYRPIAMS